MLTYYMLASVPSLPQLPVHVFVCPAIRLVSGLMLQNAIHSDMAVLRSG